jgi:hypothetical protein
LPASHVPCLLLIEAIPFFRSIQSSVVDSDSLNLDLDPAFQVNTDTDPVPDLDPGF